MVRQQERAFVTRSRRQGARAVVLEVHFMLETGGDQRVDFIVVV